MEEQRESKVVQVLQLVVQHCKDANHPKVLCSLLEVSSKVNAALRQCRGMCSITACMPPYTVWRREEYVITSLWVFTDFARWLPKHAGLVSAITLHQGDTSDASDSESEFDFNEMGAACQQLLHSDLQLATTAPAAAAADEDAQRLPLRLQAFESHFTMDTATLAALAAAEVQKVQVSLQHRRVPPSFCKAFGQLKGLQELSITNDSEDTVVPLALLEAFSNFQALKRLDIRGVQPEDAGNLPPSIVCLSIKWGPCDDHTLADLSQLTALEKLTWRAVKRFRRMRAVLPQQLKLLEVSSPVSVAPLPKLRSAELHVACNETLELLHDLKSVSKLLFLRVNVLQSAEQLAVAALQAAVTAMKQLTNLTGLGFCTGMVRVEHDHVVDLMGVPVGEAVQELKQLQSLELLLGPSMRDDLLYLTGLTKLTDLNFSAHCLDDFLASAVLLNLTNLKFLTLASAQVRTACVMPLLSRLTGLQHLELLLYDERVHMGRAEMAQLSTLTQLTFLKVRPRPGSLYAAVPLLGGALPALQFVDID